MGVIIKNKGGFEKTFKFLEGYNKRSLISILEKYGELGISALKGATPIRFGDTANAWGFEIIDSQDSITIHWTNSHINKGFSVALGIQYGHATGTGGWVQGQDYINPATKAIMDKIVEDMWMEVTRL